MSFSKQANNRTGDNLYNVPHEIPGLTTTVGVVRAYLYVRIMWHVKRRRINAWLNGFMPRVAIAHGSTLPYNDEESFVRSDPDPDHLRRGPSHGHINTCVKKSSQSEQFFYVSYVLSDSEFCFFGQTVRALFLYSSCIVCACMLV